MVALKAAQATSFLAKPPANVSAILFFGSDPGLVSERSQKLATLLAGRESPAGEVLRLDDSDLDEDSGRLAIELQTRPMFSGRKIVRATAGRRITGALIKSILADGPLEGVLIVEAGNIKPDDALRATFEKHPDALAIGCYPDTQGDLESLIIDVLAPLKMTLDRDARALLLGRLGADRSLSRAEIEKLALYAMPRPLITADDVDAIVGDAADLALERIAEAAARGEAAAAVTDYGRALASGENAQAIIAVAQRYFLKLHRVRSDLDNGTSLDNALRAVRPPLHFKQRDAFAAQVRMWSRVSLDAALKRIADAALAARRSSALEDVLAERMLLGLAALASQSQAAGQGAARRR
ncbi:MAG: DNA polymerase III subunit delta [Hyphomicrobium sp.]|nr:DNA polymerase III subunit delta [Hyphomicrobium sp.]